MKRILFALLLIAANADGLCCLNVIFVVCYRAFATL